MYYLVFGSIFIILGACMALFHWLPYRNYYIKQIANQYEKRVDERQLCQFEGLYKVLFGVISVSIGVIYVDDWRALPLFTVLIIIWAIAYYPIRRVVLNLRD